MKIRILKRVRQFSTALVGDVVETDATTGSDLACRGIAQVVEHDPVEVKAPAKKRRIAKPKKTKTGKIEAPKESKPDDDDA